MGQVLYFRSRIDDRLQPCAVCATDDGAQPKALILEVSPGASAANLPGMVQQVESIAAIAGKAGHSAVMLRPTGRGPGSVYQNYGEVDVFEAIECVRGQFAIDRDRVSITGSSMGGAATWYLASHYPDVFAAAAPFCGYCDWRLWAKPGGLAFHMHPWELTSWQARSAATLVENFRHTPVWMIHGQWDRAVGGGVPVEHSLQMDRLMTAAGIDHKLTIVPKTGHGCRKPEIFEEVVGWMLSRTKTRSPRHVTLATWSLRHNRSYWLAVDRLGAYDRRGLVDAELGEAGLAVRTENVDALTLGPIGGAGEAATTIDGEDAGVIGLDATVSLERGAGGKWGPAAAPARRKRHGASGPVADVFHEPVILVPGTAGSEEETFFNRWVADNAVRYFSSRNGGVHRGGIVGENTVELAVVPDAELTDEMLATRNLVLYGTPASNAILARFEGQVPVRFEGETVHLADKSFSGDRAAVLAVFPHPLAEQRYVAVHGGVTADAITWGAHLDMMLLPDYIAYNRGETLDWGFWDNDWRSPGS